MELLTPVSVPSFPRWDASLAWGVSGHGTCGVAYCNIYPDEASMGEVIHVAFGTEREWQQTREKTVDGLVTIGSLFGDDEKLMRAKADCVYQVLREIVEEVPSVQIT